MASLRPREIKSLSPAAQHRDRTRRVFTSKPQAPVPVRGASKLHPPPPAVGCQLSCLQQPFKILSLKNVGRGWRGGGVLIQCSPVSCLSSPPSSEGEGIGGRGNTGRVPGEKGRGRRSPSRPPFLGQIRTGQIPACAATASYRLQPIDLCNNPEQRSSHCTDEKTKAWREAPCSRVISPRNLGVGEGP